MFLLVSIVCSAQENHCCFVCEIDCKAETISRCQGPMQVATNAKDCHSTFMECGALLAFCSSTGSHVHSIFRFLRCHCVACISAETNLCLNQNKKEPICQQKCHLEGITWWKHIVIALDDINGCAIGISTNAAVVSGAAALMRLLLGICLLYTSPSPRD